jgi:hypothetical protein
MEAGPVGKSFASKADDENLTFILGERSQFGRERVKLVFAGNMCFYKKGCRFTIFPNKYIESMNQMQYNKIYQSLIKKENMRMF